MSAYRVPGEAPPEPEPKPPPKPMTRAAMLRLKMLALTVYYVAGGASIDWAATRGLVALCWGIGISALTTSVYVLATLIHGEPEEPK